MKYLVKQNFKNGGVHYKMGGVWAPKEQAHALSLVSKGLIEVLSDSSEPIEDQVSSNPTPGPQSEDSPFRELGGKEGEIKPKRGRKKKES